MKLKGELSIKSEGFEFYWKFREIKTLKESNILSTCYILQFTGEHF